MFRFNDVENLNNIILLNKSTIGQEENLLKIAELIPEIKSIIDDLQKNINLNEIKIYHLDNSNSCVAYQFYYPNRESNYQYLLFSENEGLLDEFSHYEQFSDCFAEKTVINNRWIHSKINQCD